MVGSPVSTSIMFLHAALSFLLIYSASAIGWDVTTPLDEYVHRPDPHYRYELLQHEVYDGIDSYILNMTSQKWKDETVLDHPIWWHYLVINIPKVLRFKDVATMFIGGGSYGSRMPVPEGDVFYPMSLDMSRATGSITAYLLQIPNQRIVFKDDPVQKSRSEDSLIAYTWRRYLEDPSDPEILLRMPMTKAAVRAFDTIAAFSKQINNSTDIKEFVISGASKRGWTAWATAMVDRRVVGLIPMVMDLLNMQKNLQHHYRSLGGWSFAFRDYFYENVTQYVDDPNMLKMEEIIDPYNFAERLTMAKMIVSATGDEFFLPDDSHYYYDKLLDPKYLMICENTQHSLIGHRDNILSNIVAFFLAVKTDFKLPTLTWTREETDTTGSITLQTSVEPKEIIYWAAETIDGIRDFRLLSLEYPHIHPVIWQDGPVQDLGENRYRVELEKPSGEWLAFFIAVTFEGPEGKLLEFMSEVHIIPDTFPFPACKGKKECQGTLV